MCASQWPANGRSNTRAPAASASSIVRSAHGPSCTSTVGYDPNIPTFDAFFNSTRANQTTNALSEDSLADGITFMDTLVDDSGYPITVRAASLIVRNTRLQMVAQRILNSTITGVNVGFRPPPREKKVKTKLIGENSSAWLERYFAIVRWSRVRQ